MGKKITLTHFDNKPIELDVDDIHVVGPKDKGAYIVLKTKQGLSCDGKSKSNIKND